MGKRGKKQFRCPSDCPAENENCPKHTNHKYPRDMELCWQTVILAEEIGKNPASFWAGTEKIVKHFVENIPPEEILAIFEED